MAGQGRLLNTRVITKKRASTNQHTITGQEVEMPEIITTDMPQEPNAGEPISQQEIGNETVRQVPAKHKRRRRNRKPAEFEATWKTNSKKTKHLAGFEYETRKGKVVQKGV